MKRALRLLLCLIMVFTCSIEVFAADIQVNVDGEVKNVEASDSSYFNVEFTTEDYVPSAEQVYTVTAGNRIEMWRHSEDQDGSRDGNQNWRTQWGIKDDAWIQLLMNGEVSPLTTLNQKIPEEVLNYLKNGGSWENIRVTFQCITEDGVEIKPRDIFQDGNVDCYLKDGQEFEFKFYPKFKTDTDNSICDTNNVKLNRAFYPYSYTMFSMWSKDGETHYGATRVWDEEHNEPENKDYAVLKYSDIQDSNGNVNTGLNVKNFEYPGKTQTDGQATEKIDTSVAKIGSGTFSNGGATGIGFRFPIRITFEINPTNVKADDTKIISEAGYVNLQDVDNTITNLQLYSNRDDFIEILKVAKVDRMITKLNNDATFRERVTQSILSVSDREKEECMEFARGIVNSVLTNGKITDASVYSYYRSCMGALDGLTDDEVKNLLTYGARVVLANSFQISVKYVYNELISNFTDTDIGSGDLLTKMGNSMKLQLQI